MNVRLPGTVACDRCGRPYSDHPGPPFSCAAFRCPHPTECSWLTRSRRQIWVNCLCGLGANTEEPYAWQEHPGGGGTRVDLDDTAAWLGRVRQERPKVHCKDWQPGDPEDRHHPPRCLEEPAPRMELEPPLALQRLSEPAPATAHLTPERVADLDALELQAFRDPDLTGDALLFVLCVIRAQRSRIAVTGVCMLVDLTRLWLGWDARWDDPDMSRLSRVIGHDAPYYAAEHVAYWAEGPCEAAMVRRSGKCGKRGSQALAVEEVSLIDGTIRRHSFCSRHKRESLACAAFVETRRSECPRPRPNSGGVLMRYFPDWDWRVLYLWADPHWHPPAEIFADEQVLARLAEQLTGDLPEERT